MIRPATVSDLEFILSLVPRFSEFGPPEWRNPEQIEAKTRSTIEVALRSPVSDTRLLVAETKDGQLRGFIHLEATHDYFSGGACGYVSELAVSTAGEGQGVGRALMQAGEAWARAQGYRVLTLDVFSSNEHACRFYEKLGFREEIRKYVKELGDAG